MVADRRSRERVEAVHAGVARSGDGGLARPCDAAGQQAGAGDG